MALCADDVVLESSKDGTKSGKAEFKAYLEKVFYVSSSLSVDTSFIFAVCFQNGPKGTWQDPVADGDNVIVMGKVSFMMIPVSVKAVFSFNSDDKITKIVIGKA